MRGEGQWERRGGDGSGDGGGVRKRRGEGDRDGRRKRRKEGARREGAS